MRILYSHSIQSHDGQGAHLKAMVVALRDAGHEVMVVGPGLYDAGALRAALAEAMAEASP